MRAMYDSDNIDDIPADVEAVMYYVDGEPGTPTPEQLQRFAGKTLVPITRKVGVKAKVIDVEPACVWPPSEARTQIEQGLSDTVYYGLDTESEVLAALQGLTFHRFVAHYDDNPVIDNPEWVAKQYQNSTMSGGHYDVSVLSDNWPIPANVPQENPVTNADYTDAPIEAADAKEQLAAPIVDAVTVKNGTGVYMVAADGGVFCSGDAPFHGNATDVKLAHAICAIVAAPDGSGYTLVAEDGGTFRYGNGPEVPAL